MWGAKAGRRSVPLDRPAAGQSQKRGARQGARARRPDRRPITSGRVAFRAVSGPPPVDCAGRQKGRHSTGGSRVIPQRSTNPAQLCLTSEIGRDRVYSKWFDRGMTAGTFQASIWCMHPRPPALPSPPPPCSRPGPAARWPAPAWQPCDDEPQPPCAILGTSLDMRWIPWAFSSVLGKPPTTT